MINRTEALERLDDDEELYGELLGAFFEEKPFDFVRFRTLVGNGQTGEALSMLHKLKGASGALGADSLYEICFSIEQILKGKKEGSTEALIPELTRIYGETVSELQNIRTNS